MKIKLYLLVLIFYNQIGYSQTLNFGLVDAQEQYMIGTTKYKNYYYIIEDDTGPISAKNAIIQILGFTPGMNVDIVINRIFYNEAEVYRNNITTDGSGNVTLTGVNVSNFIRAGVYRVEIHDPTLPAGSTLIHSFNDTYLVLEKETKELITGAPYDFTIHYIEDFFTYHPLGIAHMPVFIQRLKKSLRETWEKEVNEWDLCNGISRSGLNNIPIDNDSDYDIYIHTSDPTLVHFLFHMGTDIKSDPLDEDRIIHIEGRITEAYNAVNITEEEILHSIIVHEFYHGIQFSFLSYLTFITSFPDDPSTPLLNETDIEYNKRKWLIEGQAKFLETVFMAQNDMTGSPLSTTDVNTIFHLNTCLNSYEYYVSVFLNSTLQNAFLDKSIHDWGYSYCPYWRFIFENHFASSAPLRDKLAILTESCQSYDVTVPSDQQLINTFMDDVLFYTAELPEIGFFDFDESLMDFSEHIFFHDNRWKNIDGTAMNNWDDPNGNNFYDAISSYIHNPITIPTTTPYSYIYNLNSSFAFRPHLFKVGDKSEIKIEINGDPDGDGNKANFQVRGYVFNGFNLKFKKEIMLVNGLGEEKFCNNDPDDVILILVNRMDWNEGESSNYKITVDRLPAPVSTFNTAIDHTKSPLTIQFTGESTGSYVVDWDWDFGDGENSKLQSPEHEYIKSGIHDVTMTVDNCASTNAITKTDHISILPPYINKLEFTQDGSVIYTYTREYNSATHVFEFSGSGTNVEKNKELIITATTSLPLLQLELKIDNDQNKEIFSETKVKTPELDTKEWNFVVSGGEIDELSQGINILKFSGKDYSNALLISEKIPNSVPAYIDVSGTGTTQPAVNTGVDNNFVLHVKGTETVTPLEHLILNDCDEHRVIISNNENKTYTVDFGDGTPDETLPPNSFIDHSFDFSESKYKVKIYYDDKKVKVIKGSFIN